MEDTRLKLGNAPIIEAVLDIDCDMPSTMDLQVLDGTARQALGDQYPIAQRQFLSEHQINAGPDGPPSVTVRQGLQALQFLAQDRRQLIQIRPQGFSFNRLAPYSSLDDYLPEMERTWRLFVLLTAPIRVRMVRLRYINRIQLPMSDGKVDLDQYLKLAPRLPDEEKLTFVGFFNQHSSVEPATGNQVNIVFATQPPTASELPIILDIEAFKVIEAEPTEWQSIAATIASLRSLKNLVFANSLTPKCLSLFQP